MRKPKKKWNVYQVKSTFFDDDCLGYRENNPVTERYLIGETWAVSEAQALNNIRFRCDNWKSGTENPYRHVYVDYWLEAAEA